MTKALQTPHPESSFEVVKSQLKKISSLAIFVATIQPQNMDALWDTPNTLKKISKIPKVKDQTSPPWRVYPDEEKR